MVFSGAVIGMLVITLIYSITLAALSSALGKTIGELSETQVYKNLSYLLYQIVYIAVIFAFVRIYKCSWAGIGWKKTSFVYLLLAVPLAFGLLFSLNWVNELFVRLLSLFGYTAPEASLPSMAGGGFVGVLIVAALFPAVLEETLLRGAVLEGIKDIGTVATCLLGGLLFSLFHQSPTQTVYQFICGAVFTLLALRAGSVWPSVIAHFLNNAFILFDYNSDFWRESPKGVRSRSMCFRRSACLLCSSILYFSTGKTNRKKEGAIRPFLYPALPGIILCGLMWIFNLASGFGG